MQRKTTNAPEKNPSSPRRLAVDATYPSLGRGADQHIGGSSDKQPKGYNTWLEFWEGKTGKTADHCGATDCTVKGRSNLVGAHVKKVGAGDASHYITPLCKGCNNRNDEFNVDTELVQAESR